MPAGTAIDILNRLRACDPKRLAIYFTNHSSPNQLGDKEYQHIVPEAWRRSGHGSGRFLRGFMGCREQPRPWRLRPAAAAGVGHYVQKAFMGWAYMSFAVSGARPKESSIVAIRLYSL